MYFGDVGLNKIYEDEFLLISFNVATRKFGYPCACIDTRQGCSAPSGGHSPWAAGHERGLGVEIS